MAEFRRIAQPDEDLPSNARRVFGDLAIGLFVLTVLVVAIVRAAQVADDVAATRQTIETIKPCRQEPNR